MRSKHGFPLFEMIVDLKIEHIPTFWELFRPTTNRICKARFV
jgi:hypothetical protein